MKTSAGTPDLGEATERRGRRSLAERRSNYDGPVAPVSVHVERLADLESALIELGLDGGRPTIVVAGGAGGLAEPELDRLRPLFTELVLAAARLGAAVVDGGTDAGVMRLLGRARVE